MAADATLDPRRTSERSPTTRSPVSRSATSRRCSATPPPSAGRSTISSTSFHDVEVDRVVGVESRGFILAAPVAYRLRAGFVPVRKAGKLPWAVAREEYDLEYGTRQARDPPRRHPSRRADPRRRRRARHRRHRGRDRPVSSRRSAATIVGFGFLIEIAGLGGRARLGDHRVESLDGVLRRRHGNRRSRPPVAAAPRGRPRPPS